MKLIYTFLIALILPLSLNAQSPNQFSYQAIIRDVDNRLIINQDISMRISILKDTESGEVVYTETHTAKTNSNGLVTLKIGDGMTSNSGLSDVDWSGGTYFLKTETDPTGGTNYTIIGTTQILSVPYSLHSNKAEFVNIETQSLHDVLIKSNSANDQIKDIKSPTDPHDAVNMEYVTLDISKTGDTLFLGKSQFLVIPGISEVNVKSPEVNTLAATELSLSSAVMNAQITDFGWEDILEFGFEFSSTKGFANGSGTKLVVDELLDNNKYSAELAGLNDNKIHYYKAYAKNTIGTSYGDEQSFTTHHVFKSINPDDDRVSQIIGYGYDVTGAYAQSSSKKAQILDYKKMLDSGLILRDPSNLQGVNVSITGDGIEKYQSDMNSQIEVNGGIGAFNGEIYARFDNNIIKNYQYAFATMSNKQILNTFYIKEGNVLIHLYKLYPYLTDDFKHDIMNYDAKTIISTYGTDVLMGAVLGGRLDYSLSTMKKSQSDANSINAYLSAKYDAQFSVGNKDSVDLKYKNEFETTTTNIIQHAYGGATQNISDKVSFEQWTKSINDDNQVFMDYYTNYVVPISYFIQDASLKKAFDDERTSYLSDHAITSDKATIQETLIKDFNQFNFTTHIGNGDYDVWTTDNGTTEIEWSVTVSQAGGTTNTLKVDLFLHVTEMQWDHTEFKRTKTYYIPLDYDIVNFSKFHTGSSKPIRKKGLFRDDYVKFDVPYEAIHWLSDLEIRFDSWEANDGPKIGIKGKLNIPLNKIVAE